jgi:hypothetical protein
MKSTLIQNYATSLVIGFVHKVESIDGMDHNLTKGELRELFVNDVLRKFLPNQFEVGSGIIVNQAGKQSTQNDILIYDPKILPPFIKEQSIGVYPIESILCVIEVKTNLTRKSLIDTEAKFKFLRDEIGNKKYSYYPDALSLDPICGIIGFKGIGTRGLNKESGSDWLNNNYKHLMAICLVKKYSWIRTKGWTLCKHDTITFEETKRFIAVIIDTIRTKSNRYPYKLDEKHKDWLSIYIRDQEKVKKHFTDIGD